MNRILQTVCVDEPTKQWLVDLGFGQIGSVVVVTFRRPAPHYLTADDVEYLDLFNDEWQAIRWSQGRKVYESATFRDIHACYVSAEVDAWGR